MRCGKRVTLFVMLLLLIAVPSLAADKVALTILHSNDFHGMMLPFDYENRDGFFKAQPRDAGGLARRASLIESIRNATPNIAVVDAGDVFTRGPWHQKWYGVPEIEAMNLMGYDALCVGNNEVQAIWDSAKSKDLMIALVRRSRFAWLCANLTLGDGPPPGCDELAPVEGIRPFVVRTYGELRVGFLGLTTSGSSEFTFLKGWTFADEFAAARHWIPIARKECDILIAVTHIGVEHDRKLAASAPGIDVIIGGHSHTFLPEPIGVAGPGERMVPIVQAGESGVVLGRLDLVFERTGEGASWQVAGAEEKLIPITSAIPDDPAVKALLDHYLKPSPSAAASAAVTP
jgi:2',3'-cyclic-nucleotide 2'-phosphodiesterase (5'-nucleotidase family)